MYDARQGGNKPKHSIKLGLNEDDYIFVRSLSVTSQQEGLILVSFQGTKYINEEHVQQSTLAAYDLQSGAKLGEILTYGNAYTMEFSKDATRFLTDVRPGGDFVKCLDLFDLSALRNNNNNSGAGGCEGAQPINLVASLKPETDARFNYLTPDGQTLCVGLAGIDGVTFFEKCKMTSSSNKKCNIKAQVQ